MSRRMPMAPMTRPSGSRSAEAFSVVAMVSPEALRGLSRASRVTPLATTSRSAAVNSLVSSALMNLDRDCSTSSSGRKPRSWETASLAWRILPSRSETNTGSGAFAMMMSAPSERPGRPLEGRERSSPVAGDRVSGVSVLMVSHSGATRGGRTWRSLSGQTNPAAVLSYERPVISKKPAYTSHADRAPEWTDRVEARSARSILQPSSLEDADDNDDQKQDEYEVAGHRTT